ncbi:MAG: hypothetical protein F6J87_03930 [Spirulina sp. SIO3F2]|nr:hypothetical protein [Spirulina sp. SIO3F2]
MLYLAEVKKQKSGGLLAKTSTELRLLACQRNDQSWSAVPNDEVIEAEAASDFESGVMVVVNLNNNRQIQGNPELAASQIVRDLQRFSRLQEKIKAQEEEIEGWKQSLTMQAQALKEREMELDAELEELDQLRGEAADDDVGDNAASSVELEQAKIEADRIREEFERKSQELEQAWAHLRGEQQRLSEQQQAIEQTAQTQPAVGGSLEPQQAERIQELTDYLTSTQLPAEALMAQMQGLKERFEGHHANLSHYTQQLEEQRADAQQQQVAVDAQQQDWENQNQNLQNTKIAIDQSKQQVHEAQLALQLHNTQVEILEQGLRSSTTLIEQLSALTSGTKAESEANDAIDVSALEQMPIEELQGIVDELQKEYDRNARFVADQEEELKLQREAVTEIEEKIKDASIYDASALEQELADEQEQRKLLDETLMGQRRTLLEKQGVLKQHLQILHHRQGIADVSESEEINLTPILQDLTQQQAEQQEVLAQFEADLSTRKEALQMAEATLQEHLSEYDRQQSELKTLETSLNESRAATALLWGRVNLYEELLEQLRESWQETNQQLEALTDLVEQAKQTHDYQAEAVQSLNDTVAALMA